MADAAAGPSAPSGRHQRSVRNYLLDSRFQLKYAGYFVGITLVLSVLLGGLLWSAGGKVIAQSQETVEQGKLVVELGGQVLTESQKVSKVVSMNIAKEYGDDPNLKAQFDKDAAEQAARLTEQQTRIEGQAKMLESQQGALREQQSLLFGTLVLLLGLLTVGVGVAGILVTHKVAGPIFKMKRQLADVGAGSLRMPSKLRKGDELVEFFETFESMVASLRQRQEREIASLDAVIAQLGDSAPPEALAAVKRLREEMRAALD